MNARITAGILHGGRARRIQPPAPSTGVQAVHSDKLADFYGVRVQLTYPQYSNVAATISAVQELGVRHIRTRQEDGAGGLTTASRMVGLRNATSAQAWGGVDFVGPAGTYTLAAMNATPGAANTPESLVAFLEAHPELNGLLWGLSGLNEPNLTPPRSSWADDAAVMLDRLNTAIDASSVPWVAALKVLAPPIGGKNQSYFDEAETGTPAWSTNCDYGDYHLYQSGDIPSKLIDGTIVKVHSLDGLKPMVSTEGGYHYALAAPPAQYAIDEATGRVYQPRLLLEQFRRSTAMGNTNGIVRAYHYELKDKGTALNDKENVFGLCRADWSRRPSFVAMSRLIAAVSDPGTSYSPGKLPFTIPTGPPDLRSLLLQRRNGIFQLVLWRDVKVWNQNDRVPIPVTPATFSVAFNNLVKVTQREPTTAGAYTASAPTTGASASVTLDGGVKVLDVEVLPVA